MCHGEYLNKKMPKVSAVITTFNRVKFLSQAISSVFAQSMRDFELIVLDNDSDDGTAELMNEFNDPRIRYHRHEAMGISPQRNLGLSMARSEYVAFLDDDDVWLPNKLEAQLAAIDRSGRNVGLVYGGFCFYDDAGRRWGFHTPKLTGSVLQGLLWTRDPFSGSASNPMINRSHALSVGGYNNRIKVGEDWEFYLRLSDRYQIVGVSEIVLEIRQHNGPRLGQKLDEALATDRYVYRRYRSVMPATLRSRYLQKIGGKYIRLGQRLKGRKFILAALRFNFLNLFGWAQLTLSIFDLGTYRKFHSIYHRYLRSR